LVADWKEDQGSIKMSFRNHGGKHRRAFAGRLNLTVGREVSIFAESEATESCGSPGRYFKDHLELSMANENVTEKRPPQSVGFVPERLLQTDEAAAIIQIHPKTLQRFAREGVIRGIHIGKLWRFRASEIEEWIQRQTA
jgi:excisionase family DNA binding protein